MTAPPAEAGPELGPLLRWRPTAQRAVAVLTGGLAAAVLGLAATHVAVGGPVLLGLVLLGGAVLAVRRFPRLVSPDAVRWAVLAAVAVRLVVAFVAQTRPESDFLVFWDEAGALSAADGPGIGTVLQDSKAPAVVLFYGLGRWLLADGLWFAYVANALLGGLQVWLVARLAARLHGEAAVPAVAAWTVALLPSLVLHSAVVSSEVLFTTCVLALAELLLWTVTKADPTTRLLGGMGCGALLAAAHLSRNVALLYAGAWVVALLLVPVGHPRRLLAPLGAAAATFALLCAPQVAANVAERGSFSIASSESSGENLLFGTNRESDGGWNEADTTLLAAAGFVATDDPASAAELQDEARRLGLERITEDPGGFLAFALTDKYDRMWGSDRGGVEWAVLASPTLDPDPVVAADGNVVPNPDAGVWPDLDTLVRGADAAYLVVLVLGLAGVVALLRRHDAATCFVITFLAGPVVATALLHLVWEVQPRYHLPVLPLIGVLGAMGAAWLWALAEDPATWAVVRALPSRLAERVRPVGDEAETAAEVPDDPGVDEGALETSSSWFAAEPPPAPPAPPPPHAPSVAAPQPAPPAPSPAPRRADRVRAGVAARWQDLRDRHEGRPRP